MNQHIRRLDPNGFCSRRVSAGTRDRRQLLGRAEVELCHPELVRRSRVSAVLSAGRKKDDALGTLTVPTRDESPTTEGGVRDLKAPHIAGRFGSAV
jgi:hypothetical protein